MYSSGTTDRFTCTSTRSAGTWVFVPNRYTTSCPSSRQNRARWSTMYLEMSESRSRSWNRTAIRLAAGLMTRFGVATRLETTRAAERHPRGCNSVGAVCSEWTDRSQAEAGATAGNDSPSHVWRAQARFVRRVAPNLLDHTRMLKRNRSSEDRPVDQTDPYRAPQADSFVENVHGVRYQVTDVARSVAFYTTHLGFKLEHQQLPAFASISLGDAQLPLSGPGASGSRPMPDGQR